MKYEHAAFLHRMHDEESHLDLPRMREGLGRGSAAQADRARHYAPRLAAGKLLHSCLHSRSADARQRLHETAHAILDEAGRDYECDHISAVDFQLIATQLAIVFRRVD